MSKVILSVVSYYDLVNYKIATQVLVICKKYQQGRVANNDTFVSSTITLVQKSWKYAKVTNMVVYQTMVQLYHLILLKDGFVIVGFMPYTGKQKLMKKINKSTKDIMNKPNIGKKDI